LDENFDSNYEIKYKLKSILLFHIIEDDKVKLNDCDNF